MSASTLDGLPAEVVACICDWLEPAALFPLLQCSRSLHACVVGCLAHRLRRRGARCCTLDLCSRQVEQLWEFVQARRRLPLLDGVPLPIRCVTAVVVGAAALAAPPARCIAVLGWLADACVETVQLDALAPAAPITQSLALHMRCWPNLARLSLAYAPGPSGPVQASQLLQDLSPLLALRHLEIGGAVPAWPQLPAQLSSLVLRNTHISSQAFERLVRQCPDLLSLCLVHVDVPSLSMADGHQTIASLDLACLVPSCTKLHTVHVESTTLDANAYAALASLAIDSLSIVRPSGGLLFAPDTATVARMVARVSNLRLATVPWVTDGMIVQLLTGCPRLRSLSIEHLSKISDEGIRQSVQRLDDMAARQIAASQSDARTCLETIEVVRCAGLAWQPLLDLVAHSALADPQCGGALANVRVVLSHVARHERGVMQQAVERHRKRLRVCGMEASAGAFLFEGDVR
ncbi:hypothetical protein BC831DRAFT_447174 [Entophlyctis helioformis]|nr:hypothetical protein BC831DRAFT_447174 [Entophlyctis helioformis]